MVVLTGNATILSPAGLEEPAAPIETDPTTTGLEEPVPIETDPTLVGLEEPSPIETDPMVSFSSPALVA